jgi:ferredoxin
MMIIQDVIYLVLISVFIIVLFASSIIEREKRAALISAGGFFLNLIFWLILIFYNENEIFKSVNLIILIVLPFLGLISLLKFFPRTIKRKYAEIEPYDERDHMFSRNNLMTHPKLQEIYYSDKSDIKESDRKIFTQPQLTEAGSDYYDRILAEYVKAMDNFTVKSSENLSYPVSRKQYKVNSAEITNFIRRAAIHLGAADIGITKIEDYHYYSISGRQAEGWGENIAKRHFFGIAILVPMKVAMMKHAPAYPELLETVFKYVEAAKIAHIIANFIKGLGYDARAHYDARYQVLCVPLAIDAGLGALGRIGILMHPVYGPCLRLSAVTTELELIPAAGVDFSYIESFCEICKKCAENCPTNSIEGDKPQETRGFEHWGVRQETCYAFWRKKGTDCGFCIRVCPFTKPNTLIHKLVRFYISRNRINQRIALLFDDLLYGRKITVPPENPGLRNSF